MTQLELLGQVVRPSKIYINEKMIVIVAMSSDYCCLQQVLAKKKVLASLKHTLMEKLELLNIALWHQS